MAEPNPWIQERETGRWYIPQLGEDGREIRHYEEELNQGNEPGAEYDGYQQGQYEDAPTTYQEFYDERGPVDPRTQPSSSYRASPEVPRSHHSSRGEHRRRPSVAGGRTSSQTETGTSSNRRRHRGQKYNDEGGYNEGPVSSDSWQYETMQGGSSREAAGRSYRDATQEDPLAGMARLSVNEIAPSSHYGLSRSPPQQSAMQRPPMTSVTSPSIQYSLPTPTVPGRGRGYQVRGNAGAARQPSRARVIRPTPGSGDVEALDSSYRMRNTDWKKFFDCGRVFKTLWTDPAGNSQSEQSQFMSSASRAMFQVAHGEWVYSKIRRFVVVSRNNNACQCLPVTTYDGRGWRKRGIDLNQHGLISTGEVVLPEVPEIVKEPLFVGEAKEDLGISYINYGRSYCVDTNVKVKNVGKLDGPSRRLLRKYYKEIHLEDSPSGLPDDDPPAQRSTVLTGMGQQFPPSAPDRYSPPPSSYDPSRGQYEDEASSQRPASFSDDPLGPIDEQPYSQPPAALSPEEEPDIDLRGATRRPRRPRRDSTIDQPSGGGDRNRRERRERSPPGGDRERRERRGKSPAGGERDRRERRGKSPAGGERDRQERGSRRPGR